jgi:hypothetical protein
VVINRRKNIFSQGEDARCAVMLYRKERDAWEQHLKDIKVAAKLKVAASTKIHHDEVLQKKHESDKKKQHKLDEKMQRNNHDIGREDGGSGAHVSSHTVLTVRQSLGKDARRKDGTFINGGTINSKASLLSNIDIEVQVTSGDTEEEIEWDKVQGGDAEDDEDGSEFKASGREIKNKKRKISRSGFITSHSSKNFQSVADRMDNVKQLATASASADSGRNGQNSGRKERAPVVCHKTSIFGFDANAGTVGGPSRSIAEVDRALQKKQRRG